MNNFKSNAIKLQDFLSKPGNLEAGLQGILGLPEGRKLMSYCKELNMAPDWLNEYSDEPITVARDRDFR